MRDRMPPKWVCRHLDVPPDVFFWRWVYCGKVRWGMPRATHDDNFVHVELHAQALASMTVLPSGDTIMRHGLIYVGRTPEKPEVMYWARGVYSRMLYPKGYREWRAKQRGIVLDIPEHLKPVECGGRS